MDKGYVIPNLGIGWEPFGGAWWAVVSVSRGSPAHHSGFAVGPVNAPRSGTPAAVLEALLGAAADGEAALIDALGDVPVSEGGPFPGVVPALLTTLALQVITRYLLNDPFAWTEEASRYLYVYVNKAPSRPMDKLTSEFITFVLSKQGQEITIKDGYYPLPADVAVEGRTALKYYSAE